MAGCRSMEMKSTGEKSTRKGVVDRRVDNSVFSMRTSRAEDKYTGKAKSTGKRGCLIGESTIPSGKTSFWV